MLDILRQLVRNESFLWLIFVLGALNVLFATVFSSVTERLTQMFLHSKTIESARARNRFVDWYYGYVERMPLKLMSFVVGVLMMVLAIGGLAMI